MGREIYRPAVTNTTPRAPSHEVPGAGRGVSLGNMRVAVKDTESYRGKLTELWVQRARAFASAAQAHQAPLYLLDCSRPGDIRQKQQSLEEIALSLSMTCRLGSLKSAAAAAP
jgi:hypothetical protein